MIEGDSRKIDKALFEAAGGIHDHALRRLFLEAACGGDVERLARIEAWLEAAGAADEFFRGAAMARAEAGALISEGIAARDAIQKSHAESLKDEPGERIGRYRILERIGEGGCGVVYLAEQLEPVSRKVALKVIRGGLDSEKVIARFERERQALALMDHTHIARVLDAGSTESGSPYFVMELVPGVKITTHCDEHGLGIRQRLELFLQVCQAIQHAHQKGVIHRDIKPSNVLVSVQDGIAVPKVIDFGIAQTMEGWTADTKEITASDMLLGTPAYMSPEQVEGGMNLDTRSDVYSLGVLLVELLTGKTPFDRERFAQVGILEMLRILREEDPLVPSAILGMMAAEDLAIVAKHRATEPARLAARLRGDLDWIALKAMAKDQKRRYDTVNGLIMDIRRHLDDEPVLARPPSRFYALGKLVRRHKTATAALTMILFALVVGFAVSSWFYLREREAKQEQVELRKAADEARANEARLLQQSKARESVSQAAFLLAEGKLKEADELLAQTPLATIETSMEAAKVFRSLGDWNAIRQRWRQAADCYRLYLEASRKETPLAEPIDLIAIAPVLMEAGDAAEYSRFREEAVARYGRVVDVINAAILTKSCLLLPADPSLLNRLQPAIDLQATSLAKDDASRGLDSYQSAFAAMSLALVEYRRGDFEAALAWCRRCESFPDKNQARSATVHAISAMAAHRLGQFTLAQSELTRAREFFAAPFNKDEYFPRGRTQGHWQDWAIARVLLREAEKQGETKTGK